jgi:hypothetical protein
MSVWTWLEGKLGLMDIAQAFACALLGACVSSAPPPADACHENSDCLQGLICALGACRTQCASVVDCTIGGACTAVGDAGETVCVAPMGEASSGGSSGTSSVDEGTTIATLGSACETPGMQACAGHAQRIVLVCNGSWQVEQACSAAAYCDSRTGVATFATCQPIFPDCAAATPGASVCPVSGEAVCLSDPLHGAMLGSNTVICGPDLVSTTQGATCGACFNGACCASPTAVVCGVCSTTTLTTFPQLDAGACTELASDPANCGQCGHACVNGGTCVSGACQAAPVDAGTTD